MSKLRLSFDQAVSAAMAIGSSNTIMFRGSPGCGKSAIGHACHKLLPDYRLSVIDCANLDLGDLAMPVIDRERMVTEYAPSSRFGVERGSTTPVLLYLDELGKAPGPVLNMLLPVFLEHRIGALPLPVGSIVMGSTNLDSDGVGDRLPAHAYNRMTVVELGNPDAPDWIKWAHAHGCHPVILAFVRDNPQVFQRYDDLAKGATNPYIFNPLIGQVRAYVSPRSLMKASSILHAGDRFDEHTLLTLLTGTVGEAAARMISAVRATYLKLISTDAILAAPGTAPVPTAVGDQYLLAMRLSMQSSAKHLDAFVTYVLRWPSAEARTLFASSVAGDSEKLAFAMRSTKFSTLAAACGKFF